MIRSFATMSSLEMFMIPNTPDPLLPQTIRSLIACGDRMIHFGIRRFKAQQTTFRVSLNKTTNGRNAIVTIASSYFGSLEKIFDLKIVNRKKNLQLCPKMISKPEKSLTQTIPKNIEVMEHVIAWVKQLCFGVSFNSFVFLFLLSSPCSYIKINPPCIGCFSI